MSTGFTRGGPAYDPTNLNAATASFNSYTGSQLNLLTARYIPYFSGSSVFTSSMLYQSGSGTASAILLAATTGTGSISFQNYGTTYLSGALYDSTFNLGTSNQVLVSTGAGIKWVASGSGGGPSYDPTNLNAATNSLQLFSASILTYTSSTATILANIFGSESNYLPTSSFINVGTVSGSGVANYLALFNSVGHISQSLLYQSGSGTSSAILVNSSVGSGSSELQIYGATYFSGAIQDSTQNLGSAGQTLVAGTNGVVWTLTASLESLNTFTTSISLTSLNSYTGSTNTTITNVFASESNYFPTSSLNGSAGYQTMYSSSTILTSSIIFQSGSSGGMTTLIGRTVGVNNALLQIYGHTYHSGAIYDSINTTGSNNQVLVSTPTGILWAPSASLTVNTSSVSAVDKAIPVYNGTTAFSSSIMYQSGSGTGSSILVGLSTSSLLPSSITTVFQVSGGLAAIHFMGVSALPTIKSGSGAGTTGPNAGGFATITGSDSAGRINISTSGAPATSATIATITFGMTYSTAPYIFLTPANLTAGALAIASGIFVTSTTTTFVLNSNASALTAAKIYTWNYHVMG